MRVLALCVVMAVMPATASAKGSTAMTIDNAFGLEVVTSGIDAAPIAPATQDSLTLTFPIRHASVHGKRKVFEHSGGFDLEDVAHGTDLKLRNLTFAFSGKRVRISGQAFLDGIDDGHFMFARGRGTPRHVEMHLTTIAAAALNSLFLTSKFAVGDLFGAARISSR